MFRLTILLCILILPVAVKAQKVDSIFVHLYTDSLKKGTYNYINIDGRLPNGRYLPLDSSQVSFSSSYGQFYGNSLWIDPRCREEKITIRAVLKSNKQVQKEFVLYIKKKNDSQRLKTEREIMEEMKKKG